MAGGANNVYYIASVFGIDLTFYNAENQTINSAVQLTDDEKAKVQADITKMQQDIIAFLNTQTQTFQNAAPTQDQINKVQQDFLLLANKAQLTINGELTSEQKQTWEAFKLNLLLNPKLVTITLTDAQKDSIKSLVDDTAKAIVALTVDDAAKMETLQGRLYRKVLADVLKEDEAGKLAQASPRAA